MSPSVRVQFGAFLVAAIATLVAVLPAKAQFFDDARRELDLSADATTRAPRLIGMGRLTLVIPDGNNRLNLWDFAGNPTGVLDADTVSTLELRPGTSSLSSVRNFSAGPASGERQDRAARDFRVGYEFWRRSGSKVAFGAVGDMNSLRLDRPQDGFREQRSTFSQPNITPVITGQMPFLFSKHMRYAVRAIAASESDKDEYRAFSVNAAGQYIDHEGTLLAPPDFFAPDDYDVSRLGLGAALSYRFGPALTLAWGADAVRDKIKAKNEGGRYLSQREETRPYGIGQVSLAGQLGAGFQYAADARGWTSSNDAVWLFTLSQGAGANPLLGRGDLYDRKEEGSSLATRVRWVQGPLEFGASYGTSYRHVEIAPPPVGDFNSFNRFVARLYNSARNDSLVLPDTILANTTERRGIDYAAGVSWRLPGRGGIAGVEFHAWRDLFQQDLSGLGPKRVGWDVRAGLERGLTPVLTGRLGYAYRSDDRDDFTSESEFVSHAVTGGFGLHHANSAWGLETGYAFEWGQADFGTPAQPRSTRQQLAAQLRWSF